MRLERSESAADDNGSCRGVRPPGLDVCTGLGCLRRYLRQLDLPRLRRGVCGHGWRLRRGLSRPADPMSLFYFVRAARSPAMSPAIRLSPSSCGLAPPSPPARSALVAAVTQATIGAPESSSTSTLVSRRSHACAAAAADRRRWDCVAHRVHRGWCLPRLQPPSPKVPPTISCWPLAHTVHHPAVKIGPATCIIPIRVWPSWREVIDGAACPRFGRRLPL